MSSSRHGNLLELAKWAVQHVKNKIADHPLELAATATGGKHIGTFKNHTIENAVDEIGGELHSQYSVSYIPSGTNETGYHKIRVEVKKPGLKVRALRGITLRGRRAKGRERLFPYSPSALASSSQNPKPATTGREHIA